MDIHKNMSFDQAKRAAGLKALEFVESGMVLGLGTGSTAAHFIQQLIELCREGLKVEAVATSLASEKMAREGGIPLLDINTVTELNLTVDGADEIDPQKRLIKGAGGALVREKIIAAMSKEMIVIADPSKVVDQLGHRPLPVEVIPFGAEATKKHLEKRGYHGSWRRVESGETFITDNHNWIIDLVFDSLVKDPERVHREIKEIPGVVDTGFFLNLASRIIIGQDDGSATVQT